MYQIGEDDDEYVAGLASGSEDLVGLQGGRGWLHAGNLRGSAQFADR